MFFQAIYPGKNFSRAGGRLLRLKGVPEVPAAVTFPARGASLPEFPPGYPEALKQAVERYVQVSEPFEKLQKSVKPTLGYEAHRAEYAKLLEELVGPGEGPFTEKVLSYHWGHWCGTGADAFREPQAAAVALALVRDKRWPEAAGALLAARFDGRSGDAKEMLSRLVSDPEVVLAGGLALQGLDKEKRHGDSLRALLAQFLRWPGDHGVDVLVSLAGFADSSSLPVYYEALAKFVQEGPLPAGVWGTGLGVGGWGRIELPDVPQDSVSAEAQQRALEFLVAQASPSLSIQTATDLAKVFREKRRPEAEPALRRLLDHPSRKVAEAASEALRKMGLAGEVPPKLVPVRYRILVNGRPLAGSKVGWSVNSSGGGVGSQTTTDREGIMEIDRDYFQDPGKSVDNVGLHSSGLPDAGAPWFGVVLSPPPAREEVITVDVTVKPLRVTLELPRPLAEFAGKSMEVSLQGEQKYGGQNAGYWSGATLSLPVAYEVELAQVIPGDYFLQIRIPGATTWSGHLTVGIGAEKSVSLQRASDVKFQLAGLSGWSEGVVIPEVRQNGKKVSVDWDYEGKFLRGVPEGEYVLHGPSSAEVKERFRGGLSPGVEFDGVDVPLSVRADSPLEIDLGEIRVK